MDKVKEIIKKYYEDGDCGLFFSRNLIGDPMITIYSDDRITVDICFKYHYFEVFGLTCNEQKELKEFYNNLQGEEDV